MLKKQTVLIVVLVVGCFGIAYRQLNAQPARIHGFFPGIKHVVVIIQENVSFDHYFATYPRALNPAGDPVFVARPGTPSVNGLTDGLISGNLNSTKPFRLDRSRLLLCN